MMDSLNSHNIPPREAVLPYLVAFGERGSWGLNPDILVSEPSALKHCAIFHSLSLDWGWGLAPWLLSLPFFPQWATRPSTWYNDSGEKGLQLLFWSAPGFWRRELNRSLGLCVEGRIVEGGRAARLPLRKKQVDQTEARDWAGWVLTAPLQLEVRGSHF